MGDTARSLLSSQSKALPFLGVGRVADRVILATFCEMSEDEHVRATEDIFQKLLEVSKTKLRPGQRQRLGWHSGSVCCLMDQSAKYLYCLVTSSMEYPERFAFKLLEKFMATAQSGVDMENAVEKSLTVMLRPKMQELVAAFEDPTKLEDEQPGPKAAKPGMGPGVQHSTMAGGGASAPPLQNPRVLGLGAVGFVVVLLIIWQMTKGTSAAAVTMLM